MNTVAYSKPMNLSLGSKSLAFDSQWSRPAVSDIETMILRFAAFPEVGVASRTTTVLAAAASPIPSTNSRK